MKEKFFLILSIIVAGIVFYYSVVPVQPIDVGISSFDKMQHVVVYFLLTVLIYLSSKKAILSFFLAGVYGILIELIQNLLPYRFFSLFDVLANFVGAGFVFIFYLCCSAKRFK